MGRQPARTTMNGGACMPQTRLAERFRSRGSGPPESSISYQECTQRPQSSSFLGLPYRILYMKPKKELLWGLWVVPCGKMQFRIVSCSIIQCLTWWLPCSIFSLMEFSRNSNLFRHGVYYILLNHRIVCYTLWQMAGNSVAGEVEVTSSWLVMDGEVSSVVLCL